MYSGLHLCCTHAIKSGFPLTKDLGHISNALPCETELVTLNKIKPLPTSDLFCNLLITFANSLDPDQAQQNIQSGPDAIKLFSFSTQLSMKFQLLIKTKIPTNEEVSCIKSLRYGIYQANNC